MAYKVGKCLLPYHLQKNKMTQQELAERVNKTKQSISRYTNNQAVMSYETALNISKVVKCKMEELYEIIETKE